jgi:hypothetical protein
VDGDKPADAKPDESKPVAAKVETPKNQGSSATAAVVVAIIVLIGLSALAVYAYMNSN